MMEDPYDANFFTSQISKQGCQIIEHDFDGNTKEEKLERVKLLFQQINDDIIQIGRYKQKNGRFVKKNDRNKKVIDCAIMGEDFENKNIKSWLEQHFSFLKKSVDYVIDAESADIQPLIGITGKAHRDYSNPFINYDSIWRGVGHTKIVNCRKKCGTVLMYLDKRGICKIVYLEAFDGLFIVFDDSYFLHMTPKAEKINEDEPLERHIYRVSIFQKNKKHKKQPLVGYSQFTQSTDYEQEYEKMKKVYEELNQKFKGTKGGKTNRKNRRMRRKTIKKRSVSSPHF